MIQYSSMKGPRSGGNREGFFLPSSVEAMPRMLQSPGSFGIKLKDKQEGQAKRSSPARPRPAWRMALESLGTLVLGSE